MRSRRMNDSSSTSLEKLLVYHPIVLGDQVIVSDGTRVLAYNLNDRPPGPETAGGPSRGVEVVWKHDPENGGATPQVKQTWGIPRHTLTAVGQRIYARMGPANPPNYAIGMGRVAGGTESGSSSIVALDWNAQGRMIWLQKSRDLLLPNHPNDRVNRFVSFEGTPVADARNVYVAVTDRREQTATYVVCFDAESGAQRWLRYLGAASSDPDNFIGIGMGFGNPVMTDHGHRLLSLEGPTLYYQTNLGALIAIDTETGAVRWVATYPRQDLTRSGRERDLNPAVIHRGTVFVAPSDAAEIFAFDSETGRRIWKSEAIPEDLKLTHLLGVAHDRLIATGDRVLLFDAKTGKLLQAWPDSGNSIEGFGRGLLAGDKIYWPTRNEIHVLNQRTGLRTDPPIRLQETYRTSGGNLVAGDGYLIIAQTDGLVVFCQNSRLIERYRNEIAMSPKRASSHYRLAQAAEALGQDKLRSNRMRVPPVMLDRTSRLMVCRSRIPLTNTSIAYSLDWLQRSRSAKAWDEAAGYLERATKSGRTDLSRLKARTSTRGSPGRGGQAEGRRRDHESTLNR